MAEIKVYRRMGERVEIGPLRAWSVGDRVTVPSADRPFPHSDHVEGFDGIVREIATDGVAIVTPLTEDDQ